MSLSRSPSSPAWNDRTKRIVAIITLLILAYLFFRVSGIWSQLIIAVVLAYLLSPSVQFFERLIPFRSKSVNRWLAVVLTLVFIIGVILMLVWVIVPALAKQMQDVVANIPAMAEQIASDIDERLNDPIEIMGRTIIPLELLSEATGTEGDERPIDVVGMAQSIVAPLATPVINLVGSATNAFFDAFFILTIMIYLMKDGPAFVQQFHDWVDPAYQDDVSYLFRELGLIWNAYLRGQVILSLSMGIAVYASAGILGVPNPLVMGTISAILEFIPNLGPFLALIPPTILAFFSQSSTIPGLEGPLFALVVIFVWTLWQNLEAVYLVPRVLGGTLDLHPVVVLIGVLAGASLGGALGVILAAPVIATMRLFIIYIWRKLNDEPPFQIVTQPAATGPPRLLAAISILWEPIRRLRRSPQVSPMADPGSAVDDN